MKVLLLGCYYSANLGDGVIMQCVAGQIRQQYPQAEILIRDLWKRKSFDERNKFSPYTCLSQKYMTHAWYHTCLRRIASKFFGWDKQYKAISSDLEGDVKWLDSICETECDLVVFAGGQMLMDAYALKLWYLIKKFEEKGVPVILNACGTGPTFSRKLRSHLANALERDNVKSVSCRDNVQLANKYYAPDTMRIEESHDPALGCSALYGVEKDKDAKILGLGIMWAASIPPVTARCFWHRLIKELENRKIPWRIFVNGDNTDLAFARYVMETLPGFERPFEDCCVRAPEDPQMLVKTISRFQSIISFRLHSHIIAASLGIPSVAVVWDDKVRGFFGKIGHPERCCTLLDGPEKILNKLEKARQQGVDCKLIAEQSRSSAKWLKKAIKEIDFV